MYTIICRDLKEDSIRFIIMSSFPKLIVQLNKMKKGFKILSITNTTRD